MGGILNFVIKCVLCEGENSKMLWIQLEIGLVIIWKYLSCILCGDNFIGEFYFVVLISGYQQVDIGIKMIYIGKNMCLIIILKGIFVGYSQNSYCGLVKIMLMVINV